MADEKHSPPERPHRSRKRPPPTIDLSATEVKAEKSPASRSPPEAEPKAGDAAASSNAFLKYAGIGASVAAGAVATLAVLWFATHLPIGGSANVIRDRLAALEAQVNAKSSAPPAESQALTSLSQRLDKLEQVLAKLQTAPQMDPAIVERLNSIENSMRSLGVALTALTKRAEDAAANSSAARERADGAAKNAEMLQARIDELERAAKATQDKVAENGGADVAARRALAALALHDAVVRGSPYDAEIASAKNAGVDGAKLKALEPLASMGIPTDAALAREMTALLPQIANASETETNIGSAGGFIDRLQANAGKLVRIHPVGKPAGGDPSVVLARIEVKAAHNDVAGIASEFAKLPPRARELTDGWSKKLAARDVALAAARDLARDAVAALAAR